MAAAPLFEESVEIIHVLAVLGALGPCDSEGCQALHVPRQFPQPGTAAHEAQDPRRSDSLATKESYFGQRLGRRTPQDDVNYCRGQRVIAVDAKILERKILADRCHARIIYKIRFFPEM